jgi:hypothetical protein
MSETHRFSVQNKFEKLVHLVGFIIRKFVTMQGHMNVKYGMKLSWPNVTYYPIIFPNLTADLHQILILEPTEHDIRLLLISYKVQLSPSCLMRFLT